MRKRANLGDEGQTPTPDLADGTAAQQHALGQLETWLALVEGWVDVVTDEAVRGHLPNAAALSEAVRRRRASAGPAEKTFSSLVGLEMRPRQMREAADRAYGMIDRIDWPEGFCRRDIGWRALD